MRANDGDTPYVYAFVRRDLSRAQQAVQACHACIEVARSLIPPCDEHPYLVLIGVKSEPSLRTVLYRLDRLGIACQPFHDSDLENALTAIATEPVRGEQRRHFRRYQCLREESPAQASDGLQPAQRTRNESETLT